MINTTIQNHSFSGADDEHLLKMNISEDPSHSLKLRTTPPLTETDTLGASGLWSADMLYRHLQFLEGLVPQTVNSDLSTHLRLRAQHNCRFRTKPQTVCGSMPYSIALLPSLQAARPWSSVLNRVYRRSACPGRVYPVHRDTSIGLPY